MTGRGVGTAHQNTGHVDDGGQCPSYEAAGLLLLIVFAVFRMPPWLPLFVHESNGVDPSWQMLLNEAGSNGWVFGRDLFFTYGPFGFIHARMYHPETWIVLVAVWIGISVIMADLVWRVSEHGRLSSVGRTLVDIALLEFISRDAMAVCFSLHVLVFLEAVGDLRKDVKAQRTNSTVGTLRVFRQAIPILLLAALPWAKFSYFVTAAFLGGALFAVGVLQKRISWRAVLLFAACPLAWLASGATPSECGQFIGTGFQLAGGYSAAMGLGPESTAGLVVVIAAGIVVLTLPVWLIARLRFDDWRLSVLTMLFFHGLLFITWKSCFVRYHAERIPVFLGTVFPLLAYGWFMSRGTAENPTRQRGTKSNENGSPESLADASGCQVRRTGCSFKHWQSQWHTLQVLVAAFQRRFCSPLLLTGLAILISAGMVERVKPFNFRGGVAWATSPLRDQILAVTESVKDPDWRRDTHESQLLKIREANPIPKVDGSVDVFPGKLAVGFAHGLEMRPRPILQSYAAFTPKLIERDAKHFRSSTAPDHVLISVDEIDNRLPTMEDSRAWFELLSNYELADASGDLIKLSRRNRPRLTLSLEVAFRTTIRCGETVVLPALTSELAWCRIEIKPSTLGELASVLYRLPELELRVVLPGPSAERRFRLLPGSAEAGFLLSPLIEDRDDLVRLWSPDDASSLLDIGDHKQVVRFSCSTAAPTLDKLLFQPEVVVEIFEIRSAGENSDVTSQPVGIAGRINPAM